MRRFNRSRWLGVLVLVFASIPVIADEKSEAPILSGDDFYVLLESERAKIRTIRLKYTRKYTKTEESRPFSLVHEEWWYRDDGFERIDQGKERSDDAQLEHESEEWQHVKTPDTDVQYSVSSHAVDLRPLTKRTWRSHRQGEPMSVWFLGQSSSYEAEIRNSLKVHGWEDVDGHRCLKISFDLSGLSATNTSIYYFYWLDVKRGYNAIRHECQVKGARWYLTTIRLQQVGDGLWFPVYGHMEAAPSVSEIEIDPESIRVNEEMPDSTFELEYPPGTRVSDDIQGKAYVIGGQPPARKPPASQEQLDQVIADAEAQKKAIEANESNVAIEAAALSRSPWRSWPYWGLGGLSVVLTISGIILILRRL